MWALLAANLVVAAAHLVASFDFSNWSWGFNHYSLLAPPWRYAAFVAWCVLALPWVWTRASRAGKARRSETADHTSKSGTRPDWIRRNRIQILVAAGCALVFWALKMPNHLLGDGRLVVRIIEQGQWFDPAAPLDRLVHFGLFQTGLRLGGAAKWGSETVYAVTSVAAGVVYVVAAMRLGALAGDKVFTRVFTITCLLTLGTVELFFGYAESYSLAVAVMLVYFVLALEYLEGRRRFAWVAAALVLGAGFHYALIILVPSFVYLLAFGPKGPEAGMRRYAPGAAALIALVAYFLLAMRRPGQDDPSLLVVPLTSNPIVQYTLFSWRRLVDLINEQVLISPLAWLAAAGFGLAFLTQPAIRRSPRFAFLAVAGASGALYSILLRPGLGGSRDWDLWGLGAVPYVIAAVAWIARGASRHRAFQYGAYLLVLAGFFHVAPWVAVNHSAQLSVRHFNLMLEDNPLWTQRRIAAAHNEMGSFYIEKGSVPDALRHIERAVALDPNKAAHWLSLGFVDILAGRKAEAEQALRQAIALDPESATAYNNLGRLCLEQGRVPEAERALARAVQLDPDRATAHFNLGNIYESRGDPAEAARAYREAVRVQPGNTLYWYRLAKTLDRVPGEAADALAAWQRTAEIAERDPAAAGIAREAQGRLRAGQGSGAE